MWMQNRVKYENAGANRTGGGLPKREKLMELLEQRPEPLESILQDANTRINLPATLFFPCTPLLEGHRSTGWKLNGDGKLCSRITNRSTNRRENAREVEQRERERERMPGTMKYEKKRVPKIPSRWTRHFYALPPLGNWISIGRRAWSFRRIICRSDFRRHGDIRFFFFVSLFFIFFLDFSLPLSLFLTGWRG